jgi:hypothetical protein
MFKRLLLYHPEYIRDGILRSVAVNPEVITQMKDIKGFVFVLVVTVIMYALPIGGLILVLR